MTSTFDTSQISAFRFVRCTLDAQTGVVSLVYAFDQGPEFVEKIMVPGAPFALEGQRAEAVRQALRLLHLIAGVSYYKAIVPSTVTMDDDSIDAETAALVGGGVLVWTERIRISQWIEPAWSLPIAGASHRGNGPCTAARFA